MLNKESIKQVSLDFDKMESIGGLVKANGLMMASATLQS